MCKKINIDNLTTLLLIKQILKIKENEMEKIQEQQLIDDVKELKNSALKTQHFETYMDQLAFGEKLDSIEERLNNIETTMATNFNSLGADMSLIMAHLGIKKP